jgi:Leucine-rich repeat (LRR) protein
MPRLNADLIQSGAQYLNPLNQFHLDIRGYQIPYLENLAATNDQFACIDLTENLITTVEELP